MTRRCAAPGLLLALALAACATLPDPVQVSVAGIEPLPGQGMEVRMLLKLRVQNPNDVPIEYTGTTVTVEVAERPFATGVSDAGGSVPRFGETVVAVPVTVSMLHIARQVIGVLDGQPGEKIHYAMTGRLARRGAADIRFASQGELQWPPAPAGT